MPLSSFVTGIRRLTLPVLLAFCLLIPIFEARADESINEFASTVTIRPDGSLLVREEYTVTAEGERIKRGLYRDFPLRYSGPEKYRGHVPFTVLSATLDGRNLNVNDIERRGDTIRILMRNADLLPKGRHRLVLEYESSLHVRHYGEYDELNWNVTGTWALFIDKFSCRIILPKGVSIDKTVAWLGGDGSKSSDSVDISLPAPNQALFTGKKKSDHFDTHIVPGEQLTVAVSFPKGAIVNPIGPFLEKQKIEDAEREKRWEAEKVLRAEEEARLAAEEKAVAEKGMLHLILYHNPNLPLQAVACGLVFLYYFLFWRRLGKDPDKGAIIPRFHPPMAVYMGKGKQPVDFTSAPMSPLAVEYLRNHEKTTGRGLAALFLSLAAKRLCTIRKETEDVYALRPNPIPGSGPYDLSPEERAAHEELTTAASPEGELVLDPKQTDMRSAQGAADGCLSKNYSAAWTFNTWVSVLGWLVVLPLAFSLSFWSSNVPLQSSGSVELPGPARVFLISLCFMMAIALPFAFLSAGNRRLVGILTLIFPLAGVAVLATEGFFSGLEWILPTVMFAVALIFTFLMKAPSKAARAALDEIEGLAIYMGTAEKDRLEMLNRPEDSPDVFQKLLPYALVLGLEKTWCNRFADQIDAGLMRESGIDPDIVRDRRGWERFASGFSSAVAASSSMSSSSSSGSAFSSGGGAGSGSGGGGGGGI